MPPEDRSSGGIDKSVYFLRFFHLIQHTRDFSSQRIKSSRLTVVPPPMIGDDTNKCFYEYLL